MIEQFSMGLPADSNLRSKMLCLAKISKSFKVILVRMKECLPTMKQNVPVILRYLVKIF
jgi:hypothetical protein